MKGILKSFNSLIGEITILLDQGVSAEESKKLESDVGRGYYKVLAEDEDSSDDDRAQKHL